MALCLYSSMVTSSLGVQRDPHVRRGDAAAVRTDVGPRSGRRVTWLDESLERNLGDAGERCAAANASHRATSARSRADVGANGGCISATVREDRVGLPKDEVTIDEYRHKAIRVKRLVLGSTRLSLEDVYGRKLELQRQARRRRLEP